MPVDLLFVCLKSLAILNSVRSLVVLGLAKCFRHSHQLGLYHALVYTLNFLFPPPPTRGQSLKCYYLVCIISVRLLVAYLIMVIIECVVGYQLSQRALDIWVLTISGCARIVLLEL